MAFGLAAWHRLAPVGAEEQFVARVALALGLTGLVPAGLVLLRARGRVSAGTLALVLLTTLAVVLVAVYLYAVADAVRFPADILLWSEGEYASDILKLRLGLPLYGAPADFSSFTYTPGSQVMTGALAGLLGLTTSIPVLRVFQLVYVALAAVFATLACRRVLELGGSPPRTGPTWLAGTLWTAVLFLVASNTITNPFNHLLHNDALSLLLCAVAYWLLLEYAVGGRPRTLVAMALLPGIGFLVKQSLGIWAGLYLVYLAVFDKRLGPGRLALFGLAAFGSVAAAVGGCYALWGRNFIYWVFTVMGHHPVSPLRGLQHALEAWAYFAVLLAAGLALLSPGRVDRLTGAWLVAAGLLAAEAYTSGIAWMRNHMGPGSLLAGIWLLAGLARLWPAEPASGRPGGLAAARGLALALAVGFCFNGLGLVRIPTPLLPPDAHRYAAAIEREFQGFPADRVLLDYGSWIYLPQGIVMRDRAAPIGEAGATLTADWSGLLERIRNRHYAKILLRDYHTPDFAYDHGIWRQSSGVRAALEENYQETRRIPAVEMRRVPPWLEAISVLVPKPAQPGPAD